MEERGAERRLHTKLVGELLFRTELEQGDRNHEAEDIAAGDLGRNLVAEHRRVRLEEERVAEQERLQTLQAEMKREAPHRGVTGRVGAAGGVTVRTGGAMGSAEGGAGVDPRCCAVGATGGVSAFT